MEGVKKQIKAVYDQKMEDIRDQLREKQRECEGLRAKMEIVEMQN